MKILLVEDSPEKRSAIIEYVESLGGEYCIISKESLSSGLQCLIANPEVEFVILDMSMPTFDASPDDPLGGGPESFAGKEFLENMHLRSINIPVLVLSQFGSFGKGAGSKSLESLDAEFQEKFPSFYRGAIYYNSADEAWKSGLRDAILHAGQS